MAMDLFEREDHARRQTTRLLVMFAASVALIILAIYLVAALDFGSPPAGRMTNHAGSSGLWNPGLFAAVALGTIVVIAVGAFIRSPNCPPAASRWR